MISQSQRYVQSQHEVAVTKHTTCSVGEERQIVWKESCAKVAKENNMIEGMEATKKYYSRVNLLRAVLFPRLITADCFTSKANYLQ